MTGLIVFAHGSRVESANESVRKVAAQLGRAGNYPHVQPAFLELAEPDLPEAVRLLVAQKVSHVVVLPYFLTLGTHLQRDLPRIANEIRGIYQGVTIEVTEPLDGHPALLEALLDRAGKAVNGGRRSGSQAG